MKEELTLSHILILTVVGFLLLTFIYLLFAPLDWWSCRQRWNDSNLEYKYSVFSGCKVKTEQFGWIPEDNVRAND